MFSGRPSVMRASIRACVRAGATSHKPQWTEFYQILVDDVDGTVMNLLGLEGRWIKTKVAARSDVQNLEALLSSGGSRKKIFGGLAPHHLGANND